MVIWVEHHSWVRKESKEYRFSINVFCDVVYSVDDGLVSEVNTIKCASGQNGLFNIWKDIYAVIYLQSY